MADSFSNWVWTKRSKALEEFNSYKEQVFAESPTQTRYLDRTVLLEQVPESRISITQVISEKGLGNYCKMINIPHQVKVMQLKDLRNQKDEVLQDKVKEHLFSLLELSAVELGQKLAAEHLAYLDDAFIILAPDDLSATINIGFLLKETKHLHVLLLTGKNNKLSITIDVRSEIAEATYVQELFAGEGSRMNVIMRESAVAGNLMSLKLNRLPENASLKMLTASKADNTLISKAKTFVSGKGTINRTYALFAGRADSRIEQESTISHLVEGGDSETATRGIVQDNSVCLVKGTIHIALEAPKTKSHYEGKVLEMGENAKANVLPTLRIFTNDVEAKHGAGVGSFSPEEIFYLQSRGLSKPEAKKMLTDGFFNPLMKEFTKQDQEGINNFFRI